MKQKKYKILFGIFALLIVAGLTDAVTVITDSDITTANISLSNALSGGHSSLVIVAADGTGEYTNLKTAIDAHTNAYVYVKEGYYDITESIEVDNFKNITVVCAGWGSTIYGNANTGDNGIFYVENSTFTIQNCHLDGDGMLDITSPMCLNARQADTGRLVAKNNLIENCLYDGVYTKGLPIHLQGNEIRGSGRHGIAVVDGDGHTILNNYVHDVGATLINVENVNPRAVNDLVIQGNRLIGAPSGSGISTGFGGGARSNFVIRDNYVRDTNLYGIYTYNVTGGAHYIGNKVENTGNIGIMTYENGNSVVTGNTVKDAGTKCINIKQAPFAVISSNMAENCGSYGIYFESSGTGQSVVSANIVKNATGFGMIMNAEYSAVTGNLIYNVGTVASPAEGMRIAAPYVNVVGNTIYDNRGGSSGLQNGIGIVSGYSGISVTGNVIGGQINNKINNTGSTYSMFANSAEDNKIVGEVSISTVTGSGKAVCVKADGNLGVCSDAVGVGGTCTCA